MTWLTMIYPVTVELYAFKVISVRHCDVDADYHNSLAARVADFH